LALKQKEVQTFLANHKTFAADTMLFIYHFEDHPRYAPITEHLFASWEKGTHSGITSVITLLEILVKPRRDENWEAVRDYKDLLLTFPNLQVVSVEPECAELASDLRARYGIRTPDAIQIASAVLYSATAFVTNDDQMKQITELDVILLDEFLTSKPTRN
jgi:predicted nucleic acid-binding protein